MAAGSAQMVWDGEEKQLFDVLKLEFELRETLCLPALRGRRVFPLSHVSIRLVYGQRILPHITCRRVQSQLG